MAHESSMIKIVGDSIQIGPVPFNIYYKDKQAFPALFCRKGYDITPQRRAILREHNRSFFVQREELPAYLDYAGDKIREIINNPEIPLIEKVDLVKSVGKRMRRRIIQNPQHGVNQEAARSFIDGYIDLILDIPGVRTQLFDTIEKNEYLLARSFNVCTLSLLMGEVLYKNSKRHLRQLGIGAMLLDVGMTKIDNTIIQKDKALTEDEYDAIKLHPFHSDLILSNQQFRPEVLSMVLQHHERFDGSGYPHALTAEEIHNYAQIAAVADTYDAITSNRPYKDEKNQLEALIEMAGQKHAFNLKVFETLLRVVLVDDKLVEYFIDKYEIFEK